MAGPDAVMIVPFDIDEDGRMDIIVQKEITKLTGKTSQIGVIYNNMVFDSFFVKVVMLSKQSDNPNANTYGALTQGATFRYIVTTLDDEKFVRVAT